jgi:hypothetical protein
VVARRRDQVPADSTRLAAPERHSGAGHQTDLAEFYPVTDLHAADLHEQLALWQHAYNWDRPHSSLGGRTPIDHVCELIDRTPLAEAVDPKFHAGQERFRHPEYAVDLALLKLKRSL